MPRKSRTPEAARRATFARAERLQREAEQGDRPERQQAKSRPDRQHTPKGDRPAQSRPEQQRGEQKREDRPRAERAQTTEQTARARAERSRERNERQRLDRLKAQTRAAFTRNAERRRDQEGRTAFDKQRQQTAATIKRVQDHRQRDERKRADLRRAAARQSFNRQGIDRREQARRADQDRQRQQIAAGLKRAHEHKQRTARQRSDLQRAATRKAFNVQGDRRRDLVRREAHQVQAQLQRELEKRAAPVIDATHKRQRADQQAAHRWQTDQVRTRHQRETQSFQRNESMALERHHHAIKGVDHREDRALADFEARRTSLTGRIAEAVPGRKAANDDRRAEIVRGFEAERMTMHRDLEALKERQFQQAQNARLGQARERLVVAQAHRAERTGLEDRQRDARPELVKVEARTIERVDRERAIEAARVRQEPERERVRPGPAFAKA